MDERDGQNFALCTIYTKYGFLENGEFQEDMVIATISIQVDEEVAIAYAEMSPQEQYLLRLRLQNLALSPKRSLQDVMDEIGQQAQARGMTSEYLASLLEDV